MTLSLPLNLPTSLHATANNELTHLYGADGAIITETITTSIAGGAVTTTISRTRITNPYLPVIGDLDHVRMEIAAYAGIVVGAQLRYLRAIGPAIAAVNWAEHDERLVHV